MSIWTPLPPPQWSIKNASSLSLSFLSIVSERFLSSLISLFTVTFLTLLLILSIYSKYGHKLIKTTIFLNFFWSKMSIYSKFCKATLYFFVPKVLRIIFYPQKHLSQSQKLKTGQKKHFFGTPCRLFSVGWHGLSWNIIDCHGLSENGFYMWITDWQTDIATGCPKKKCFFYPVLSFWLWERCL